MNQPNTSVDEIRLVITLAEGSGRVEYKRSCLWPLETRARDVQSVLMRLANANPDTGGVIELGREDDGQRVGLVDKDLQRVSTNQLKAAEQVLVQIADRMRPPMQVRWQPLPHDDGTKTITIVVPGRARGHWFQDEQGVTKTGSASHPVIATPDMLRAWVLEEQTQERGKRVTAFRRQLATLQRQASDMMRMDSAAANYPRRFDVTNYNQLLPEVSGPLPESDPLLQRLHDLPAIANTINRLMDLSGEERRAQFSYLGDNSDPDIVWRMALQSAVRELERQCQECETGLSGLLG